LQKQGWEFGSGEAAKGGCGYTAKKGERVGEKKGYEKFVRADVEKGERGKAQVKYPHEPHTLEMKSKRISSRVLVWKRHKVGRTRGSIRNYELL
jgi:hypothetical protein